MKEGNQVGDAGPGRLRWWLKISTGAAAAIAVGAAVALGLQYTKPLPNDSNTNNSEATADETGRTVSEKTGDSGVSSLSRIRTEIASTNRATQNRAFQQLTKYPISTRRRILLENLSTGDPVLLVRSARRLFSKLLKNSEVVRTVREEFRTATGHNHHAILGRVLAENEVSVGHDRIRDLLAHQHPRCRRAAFGLAAVDSRTPDREVVAAARRSLTSEDPRLRNRAYNLLRRALSPDRLRQVVRARINKCGDRHVQKRLTRLLERTNRRTNKN